MVANGRSDTLLISQAKRGDEQAWEQIVRQCQEPAFRLAYLILGDVAEAEEATQDAFVRAYLHLTTFDEQRPFRPWLLQITRNLAHNRHRSWGRYWAKAQQWWQEVEADRYDGLPHDEAQALWQAVQQLRPAAQQVIYLRYFLALSEAETATVLNIRPGTVKSRLHRALQRLRLVLEHDG